LWAPHCRLEGVAAAHTPLEPRHPPPRGAARTPQAPRAYATPRVHHCRPHSPAPCRLAPLLALPLIPWACVVVPLHGCTAGACRPWAWHCSRCWTAVMETSRCGTFGPRGWFAAKGPAACGCALPFPVAPSLPVDSLLPLALAPGLLAAHTAVWGGCEACPHVFSTLCLCGVGSSGSGGGGGGVSSPLCNAGAGWSVSFQTPGASCSSNPQDDVTGQASNSCTNQCSSSPGGDFNAVRKQSSSCFFDVA
jgi:hypothetical protein